MDRRMEDDGGMDENNRRKVCLVVSILLTVDYIFY